MPSGEMRYSAVLLCASVLLHTVLLAGAQHRTGSNVKMDRSRKPQAGKVQRNVPAWRSPDLANAASSASGSESDSYCDLMISCRGNRYNSTRIPITLPIQGPPGPPGAFNFIFPLLCSVFKLLSYAKAYFNQPWS